MPNDKVTQLFEAIHQKNIKRAAELISAGADPNGLDPVTGVSAMKYATMKGDPAMIAALSTRDLESREPEALQSACLAAQPTLVARLLENGADPNSRSNDGDPSVQGRTPLMFACGAMPKDSTGLLQVIKLLIAADADINAVDIRGRTALIHLVQGAKVREVQSQMSGDLGVMKLLMRAFAPGIFGADDGKSSREEEAVRYLVEAGANVNARDKLGMSSLVWAKRNRSGALFDLLQSLGGEWRSSDEKLVLSDVNYHDAVTESAARWELPSEVSFLVETKPSPPVVGNSAIVEAKFSCSYIPEFEDPASVLLPSVRFRILERGAGEVSWTSMQNESGWTEDGDAVFKSTIRVPAEPFHIEFLLEWSEGEFSEVLRDWLVEPI